MDTFDPLILRLAQVLNVTRKSLKTEDSGDVKNVIDPIQTLKAE